MRLELVNLNEINLDNLPERKAVYAIFAQDRETKKPFHCRYVDQTDNLMKRIKAHFSVSEQNKCLRAFMQSGRIKLMFYELIPGSSKEERHRREKDWINLYQPRCNE